MITHTHRASSLFTVRRRGPLAGNPDWADLVIDSNRTLQQEQARGAGLYAIHYRDALVYVGKFCGKRKNPFDGRVCDIRWARHMGTLTLRDRRISMSEGRCHQLRSEEVVPLAGIVQAMPAGTIFKPRGRCTSVNRALFAAEHWAALSAIQDAAGLADFSLTYTQVEPADVAPERIRAVVSAAEKHVIAQLQPRCNGEVREGNGGEASIDEAARTMEVALRQSIYAQVPADGTVPPPPPDLPPVAAGEGSDDDEGDGDERRHVAPPEGPEDPNDPDDPGDVTPEEFFWERIDGQDWAQAAAGQVVEAVAGLADADHHFTFTNKADLRVHSLAGPPPRFNVACFSWQPRRSRFTAEIGLPVNVCLALGASTSRPNHAGKTLESIATFDTGGPVDALARCALEALRLRDGPEGPAGRATIRP